MNRLNSVLKNISDKKAVLFVGAGMSSIAGCYNWDQIITKLSQHSVVRDECENQQCDFSTLDNDEIIDYFEDLFKRHDKEKDFWDILVEAITEDADQFQGNYLSLVKTMKQIKPFPKVVTTNIDDCFERAGEFKPSQVYYEEKDLVIVNFNNDTIFHIHGYKLDFKAALWTRKKYLVRYSNTEFKALLKEVFCNHSVIFLGCGLKEDLLRNILRECKQVKSDVEHFALMPSDGRKISDAEIEPYKSLFGINIIYYGSKDDFYNQLSKWIKINFIETSVEASSAGASSVNG